MIQNSLSVGRPIQEELPYQWGTADLKGSHSLIKKKDAVHVEAKGFEPLKWSNLDQFSKF